MMRWLVAVALFAAYPSFAEDDPPPRTTDPGITIPASALERVVRDNARLREEIMRLRRQLASEGKCA